MFGQYLCLAQLFLSLNASFSKIQNMNEMLFTTDFLAPCLSVFLGLLGQTARSREPQYLPHPQCCLLRLPLLSTAVPLGTEKIQDNPDTIKAKAPGYVQCCPSYGRNWNDVITISGSNPTIGEADNSLIYTHKQTAFFFFSLHHNLSSLDEPEGMKMEQMKAKTGARICE
ncbi:hypothetical protein MAR_007864 [Mya arenaria]|uniref:Uncharacterized protein n=1 Tax=Mya arenaria TaxID=6604 RepID=A0ABY7DYD6_MYAAR|nr:hypothetical protein MAR_007864 [Mya arenaria]